MVKIGQEGGKRKVSQGIVARKNKRRRQDISIFLRPVMVEDRDLVPRRERRNEPRVQSAPALGDRGIKTLAGERSPRFCGLSGR